MEQQNLNNSPGQQTGTTTTTKRRPGKLAKYILNHKGIFSLLFALIVVFIWAQCQINKLEKENQTLTLTYKAQADSLQKADFMVVSKVFSWAVRSDMMRNNYDQANQYIKNIVKEKHIKKAYAIDAAGNTIILSTNKQEVGLPVSDITLLQPAETTIMVNDSTTRYVTPITGLNRKIGISVIETDLK
ncbi:MAG: hypothetical protein ACYC2P_10040 [Paludibacteraceae bacterium]